MNQTLGTYLGCLLITGLGALMLFGRLVSSDANPEQLSRTRTLMKIGGGCLLIAGAILLARRLLS